MFGVGGGRGLGAIVRADVRVCLAGSGRCYLECTVGGPVVYMGRDREGGGKQRRAYGVGYIGISSCTAPLVSIPRPRLHLCLPQTRVVCVHRQLGTQTTPQVQMMPILLAVRVFEDPPRYKHVGPSFLVLAVSFSMSFCQAVQIYLARLQVSTNSSTARQHARAVVPRASACLSNTPLSTSRIIMLNAERMKRVNLVS